MIIGTSLSRRLCSLGWMRAVHGGAVQCRRKQSSFCFPVSPPKSYPCWWCTLCNGIRVCTEFTQSPLSCVTLLIEGGSRFESPCNNGAYHFFEHLVLKGPQNPEINFNIKTGREFQIFTATCCFERVEAAICQLAQIFTNFNYSEDVVNEARCEMCNEISNVEKDMKKLCFDYLHQTAFQGTPMAMSPIAPLGNYEYFTADYMAEFACRHYMPSRMVLTISSTMLQDDAIRMATAYFGKFCPSADDCVDWPCRYSGSMVRYRDDLMPYMHSIIAFECPGARSDDYHTINMMKHMIGRWDITQHQKYATWPAMAQGFAEGELSSHYECFYLPYMDTGLFGIYCITAKDVEYEDTLYQIQDKLMNMCFSCTTGDVERARNSYLTELAWLNTGCINSCLDMAKSISYHGQRSRLDEIFHRVCSTPKEVVQRVAENILYDRCPALAGLGPTESIPEYNRIRNGMQWLRI